MSDSYDWWEVSAHMLTLDDKPAPIIDLIPEALKEQENYEEIYKALVSLFKLSGNNDPLALVRWHNSKQTDELKKAFCYLGFAILEAAALHAQHQYISNPELTQIKNKTDQDAMSRILGELSTG